jgi:hypothetical protein
MPLCVAGAACPPRAGTAEAVPDARPVNGAIATAATAPRIKVLFIVLTFIFRVAGPIAARVMRRSGLIYESIVAPTERDVVTASMSMWIAVSRNLGLPGRGNDSSFSATSFLTKNLWSEDARRTKTDGADCLVPRLSLLHRTLP